MTHTSRIRNLATKLALLVSCTAAFGCKSGNDKEAPKPASSIAAATPEATALKAAFAYVGPVGDAGWTFAHDSARKAATTAASGKVSSSFVENVPEAADAERVIRDMAEQGNKLIFGTTFGYMEP